MMKRLKTDRRSISNIRVFFALSLSAVPTVDLSDILDPPKPWVRRFTEATYLLPKMHEVSPPFSHKRDELKALPLQSLEEIQLELSQAEFDVVMNHMSALQEDLSLRPWSLSVPRSLEETGAVLSALEREYQGAGNRSVAGAAPESNLPVSLPQVPPGQTRAQILALQAERRVQSEVNYVEAFDFDRAVEGVHAEMISQEGLVSNGEVRGWNLATATDHWPTLSWISSSSTHAPQVPLLSQNTIQLLAKIKDLTLNASEGLVFGKVARGWKVEISGQAEAPLFLSSSLQILSPEQIEEDRYFVILNSSPGSSIVYLYSEMNAASASVAVPVLSGTASFLDLTQLERSLLSGQVIENELSSASLGESQSESTVVRVVGQSALQQQVDREGRFAFPDVFTVADYPLYLEVDKGLGFTHRYKVFPEELNDLTLFRVPADEVQGWLGQLEGGVSQNSGLIIAAVPGLVEKFSDLDLIPSIREIPSSNGLRPETYTLTPRGRLQPGISLQALDDRFLGVEIPDGPVLVQITDSKSKVVWSELVMTSPGVINLIGPY